MRLSAHLVRNVLTGYLGYVSLIVSFFLLPFVVSTVSPEVYGIWVIAWGVVGYFNVLEFGVGAASARFVADALARSDEGRMNQALSTCWYLYAVGGSLTMLGSFAVAMWAFPHFAIPQRDLMTARVVLIVAGMTMGIAFPMRIYPGVLTGLQRLDLVNVINVAVALTNAAGTLGVLLAGWGIVGMAWCNLAVTLAGNVAMAWTARKLLPGLRLEWRHVSVSMLREVSSFSGYVFVGNLCVQLSYRTDALVIGYFLPAARVTVYQIGLRLNELAMGLPQRIATAVFPAAAKLEGEADASRLRSLVIMGTRCALEIFLPVFVFLMVFGDQFIHRWMGSGFSESTVVLRWLIVAGLAATAQSVAAAALQGVGRPQLITWIAIADSLANLVLSILFVQWLGAWGVALATAIPIVISNVFLVIPLALRRLQIPLREFVSALGRRVGLLAAVLFTVALGMRAMRPPASWPHLVLEFCILAVVAALVLLMTGSSEERALYRRVLSQVHAVVISWVGHGKV